MRSWKKVLFLASILGTVTLQAADREAADNNTIVESNIGVGTKLLLGRGPVFGFEYNFKPSEHFMIGGVGYTGQITGTTVGFITWGGLSAAYLATLGPKTRLEFALMMGASGGINNGTQFGGTVLEPQVRINWDMGGHVRIGLNVGYCYLSASATNGGLTGGIQFQFYDLFTSAPHFSSGK